LPLPAFLEYKEEARMGLNGYLFKQFGKMKEGKNRLKMDKALFFGISIWLFSCFFYPASITSQVSLHEKIVLRGFDGDPLSIESKIPYSPKKTCGACHEYDRITNGYHFQQGRTDGAGKIVISDTYDSKYPWNLSSGMYGKY